VQDLLFNFLDKVHGVTQVEPTPAHHAIKELLTCGPGADYITSNLDGLEKRIGYSETIQFNYEERRLERKKRESHESVTYEEMLEREKNESVTIVDDPQWLLMVGLRCDDYGIATWAEERAIPIFYVGPNAPELSNIGAVVNKLAKGETPPQLRNINFKWLQFDAQSYLPDLVNCLA
jgi:Sir2 family